jgi:hypothetical protein
MFTDIKFITLRNLKTNLFREGEDDAAKAAEAAEAAKTAEAAKAAEAATKGRKFTQDEVNNLLKKDKDAAKTERDNLKAQLERLKEQGLTTENLTALQERIDQLANDGKTKEEQAKDALANKDKEWAKKFDISTAEAKKWRGDYEKYRAESEILAAASKYKADNPSQIHRLLRGDIKYVEKLDGNGKGTGEWLPKVSMEVTKDGETKVLELSPDDAVKQMTEMDEHHNLFNSGASAGLGGSNNGGSKGSGGTAVPRTMNAYMAARKKDPKLHARVGKEDK